MNKTIRILIVVIFLMVLAVCSGIVFAVEEVTLERFSDWKGTYAGLNIPGTTFSGSVDKLYVVPRQGYWEIKGRRTGFDFVNLGKINNDGAISFDSERLRRAGVSVPSTGGLVLNTRTIQTDYDAATNAKLSYTPTNLVQTPAESTGTKIQISVPEKLYSSKDPEGRAVYYEVDDEGYVWKTYDKPDGKKGISWDRLSKSESDELKPTLSEAIIPESIDWSEKEPGIYDPEGNPFPGTPEPKDVFVEVIYDKNTGKKTAYRAFEGRLTALYEEERKTFINIKIDGKDFGASVTIPDLNKDGKIDQKDLQKHFADQGIPGTVTGGIIQPGTATPVPTEPFKALISKEGRAMLYENGKLIDIVSKEDGETWLKQKQKEQLEKAIKEKGYKIKGTDDNGNFVLIRNNKYYTTADGKTINDVAPNQEITIDEGSEGGVDVKTTYKVRVEKEKQTLDFVKSNIGGVELNDKAAFDDIKTKIGKLPKGQVKIEANTILTQDKMGRTTFSAEKKEKEVIIRNDYVGGKNLNEMVYSKGNTIGGITNTGYELRFFKDGKLISPRTYGKLKKEEKARIEIRKYTKRFESRYYELDDKTKQRDLTKIVSTSIGTIWLRKKTVDGKDVITSEINIEKLIFEKEGTIVKNREFYYAEAGEGQTIKFDENGNPAPDQAVAMAVFDEEGNLKEIKGSLAARVNREDFEKRAKTARKQAKSRRFFKLFELSLTQFKGLRGWHMLLDREGADQWRADIDRFFSERLLGTKYWASEICRNEYDKSIEGVAFAELPDGVIMPQAYVAGEKSSLVPYQTEAGELGFQRLYKLTFYVRASYQDVEFNVVLDGKQLYPADIRLKGDEEKGKGEEFSATGSLAIVQYSTNEYNQICIDFKAGPMQDICNAIVESDGSITNYQQSGGPVGGFQTGGATPQNNPIQI